MSISAPVNGLFGEAKSVLRFYDHPLKRNEYIKLCKDVCEYKLLVANDKLIPFQILRPYNQSEVTSFKITDVNGVEVYAANINLLTTRDYDETSVIIFAGEAMGFVLACGFYYIEITDDTNATYYSEKFYTTPYTVGPNLVLNLDGPTLELGWGGDFSNATVSETPEMFCGEYEIHQFILSDQNDLYEVYFQVLESSGHGLTISFGNFGDIYIIPIAYTGEYRILGKNPGISYSQLTIQTDAGAAICITNPVVRKATLNYDRCYPALKWWNTCGNIGTFYYGDDYFNLMYLDKEVELEELDPKYTIKGFDNGNDDFVPTFQKLLHYYKIKLGFLPRFVVDALLQVQLHDRRKLIFPDPLGESYIDNVEISVEHPKEIPGCFSEVEFKFSLPENTLSTGCCDDDFLTTCTEAACDPLFDAWVDHLTSPIQAGSYLDSKTDDWTIVGNNAVIDYINGDNNIVFCIPLQPNTWYALTYTENMVDGTLHFAFDVALINSYTVGNTTTGFFYSGAETEQCFRVDGSTEADGQFTFSTKRYDGCWNPVIETWPPGNDGAVFNTLDGGIKFIYDTGTVILVNGTELSPLSTYAIIIDVEEVEGVGEVTVYIEGIAVYTISFAGIHTFTIDPRDLGFDPLPSQLEFSLVFNGIGVSATINSVNINSCTYSIE